MSTRQREDLLVQVLSWWSGFQVSRLVLALVPILFDYHSLLALFTDRPSLLSRISVANHCVYALMLFFVRLAWLNC